MFGLKDDLIGAESRQRDTAFAHSAIRTGRQHDGERPEPRSREQRQQRRLLLHDCRADRSESGEVESSPGLFVEARRVLVDPH